MPTVRDPADYLKKQKAQSEPEQLKAFLQESDEHLMLKVDDNGVVSGRCVITTTEYQANDIICAYKGRDISYDAGLRLAKQLPQEGENCYLMFVKGDPGQRFCVDATSEPPEGIVSYGRLINHAPRSRANSYSMVFMVDGQRHVFILAKTKIKIGQEIRYDYGETGKAVLEVLEEASAESPPVEDVATASAQAEVTGSSSIPSDLLMVDINLSCYDESFLTNAATLNLSAAEPLAADGINAFLETLPESEHEHHLGADGRSSSELGFSPLKRDRGCMLFIQPQPNDASVAMLPEPAAYSISSESTGLLSVPLQNMDTSGSSIEPNDFFATPMQAEHLAGTSSVNGQAVSRQASHTEGEAMSLMLTPEAFHGSPSSKAAQASGTKLANIVARLPLVAAAHCEPNTPMKQFLAKDSLSLPCSPAHRTSVASGADDNRLIDRIHHDLKSIFMCVYFDLDGNRAKLVADLYNPRPKLEQLARTAMLIVDSIKPDSVSKQVVLRLGEDQRFTCDMAAGSLGLKLTAFCSSAELGRSQRYQNIECPNCMSIFSSSENMLYHKQNCAQIHLPEVQQPTTFDMFPEFPIVQPKSENVDETYDALSPAAKKCVGAFITAMVEHIRRGIAAADVALTTVCFCCHRLGQLDGVDSLKVIKFLHYAVSKHVPRKGHKDETLYHELVRELHRFSSLSTEQQVQMSDWPNFSVVRTEFECGQRVFAIDKESDAWRPAVICCEKNGKFAQYNAGHTKKWHYVEFTPNDRQWVLLILPHDVELLRTFGNADRTALCPLVRAMMDRRFRVQIFHTTGIEDICAGSAAISEEAHSVDGKDSEATSDDFEDSSDAASGEAGVDQPSTVADTQSVLVAVTDNNVLEEGDALSPEALAPNEVSDGSIVSDIAVDPPALPSMDIDGQSIAVSDIDHNTDVVSEESTPQVVNGESCSSGVDLVYPCPSFQSKKKRGKNSLSEVGPSSLDSSKKPRTDGTAPAKSNAAGVSKKVSPRLHIAASAPSEKKSSAFEKPDTKRPRPKKTIHLKHHPTTAPTQPALTSKCRAEAAKAMESRGGNKSKNPAMQESELFAAAINAPIAKPLRSSGRTAATKSGNSCSALISPHSCDSVLHKSKGGLRTSDSALLQARIAGKASVDAKQSDKVDKSVGRNRIWRCVIKNCRTTPRPTMMNADVSFHAAWRSPASFQGTLDFVKKFNGADFKRNNTDAICSHHFKDSDYRCTDGSMFNRYLDRRAVPSLSHTVGRDDGEPDSGIIFITEPISTVENKAVERLTASPKSSKASLQDSKRAKTELLSDSSSSSGTHMIPASKAISKVRSGKSVAKEELVSGAEACMMPAAIIKGKKLPSSVVTAMDIKTGPTTSSSSVRTRSSGVFASNTAASQNDRKSSASNEAHANVSSKAIRSHTQFEKRDVKVDSDDSDSDNAPLAEVRLTQRKVPQINRDDAAEPHGAQASSSPGKAVPRTGRPTKSAVLRLRPSAPKVKVKPAGRFRKAHSGQVAKYQSKVKAESVDDAISQPSASGIDAGNRSRAGGKKNLVKNTSADYVEDKAKRAHTRNKLTKGLGDIFLPRLDYYNIPYALVVKCENGKNLCFGNMDICQKIIDGDPSWIDDAKAICGPSNKMVFRRLPMR